MLAIIKYLLAIPVQKMLFHIKMINLFTKLMCDVSIDPPQSLKCPLVNAKESLMNPIKLPSDITSAVIQIA